MIVMAGRGEVGGWVGDALGPTFKPAVGLFIKQPRHEWIRSRLLDRQAGRAKATCRGLLLASEGWNKDGESLAFRVELLDFNLFGG